MNRSIPALAAVAASLALMAGSALAHDPTTMAATETAKPDVVKSAVKMPTETGTKTIRSGMPAQPATGPAPAFATLDTHNRGYLDSSDAEAYPMLGTDFIMVDANRDGQVSKAEYESWVAKQ